MRVGHRGRRQEKNKEKKDDRVEVKKRSKDRQKKKEKWGKTARIKNRVGVDEKQKGSTAGKGSTPLLPPCLSLSPSLLPFL